MSINLALFGFLLSTRFQMCCFISVFYTSNSEIQQYLNGILSLFGENITNTQHDTGYYYQ